MSEPLPILSSTQVQEKGTYDLLAPLALLFYSTLLCVSSRMGQPWGLRGREGKNSLLGRGRALTAPRIKAQREKLCTDDTADECYPSDGFR